MQHLLKRTEEVQRELSILSSTDAGSIVTEVFDSLPLMIWICDAEGACTYTNKRWLEFRGRTMSEEAGMGWIAGIHPDDVVTFLQSFKNVLQTHEPETKEFRLLSASGQYRDVLDVGIPKFNNEDRFIGYVAAVSDISVLKAAEQYSVKLRTLAPKTHLLPTFISRREREVLELVASGLANAQIADRLHIGIATVETHRSHLLARLQVPNSAALVRRAIRLGLIAP